jgi:outer membrane protein OmpA-like peptidoglycan-associated protein
VRRTWVIVGIVVIAVAIAAAVVIVKATDSGSSSESTTQWADDVCTSLSDWRSSIESLATVSGGSLSRDDLRQKLSDAQVATEQLITDLKDIGPPDTESGTQLKQQLQDSADQLQQSYENLKAQAQDALNADSATAFLQGLAQLAPDFQNLLNETASTLDTLQSTDVAGSSSDEIKQAFDDADSCQALRSAQD